MEYQPCYNTSLGATIIIRNLSSIKKIYIQQYFQHKSSVQNIKYAKKTFVNNKEPFGLKPSSVTSRPERGNPSIFSNISK